MKQVQADVVWILTLAVVVWIGYAVARALVISWRARQAPRSAAEEFSRAEKVRQQVRRKKAERATKPEAGPRPVRPPVPLRPPRGVPPLDSFGGRWRERLRRWMGRGDPNQP